MRYNGSIQGLIVTPGGVDRYGEVMEASTELTEPYQCAIKVNSDTRKGVYQDGEFRQASYSILTEGDEFPHDRVILKRGHETLGEYRVLNVEPLTSLGRVEITV